MVMPWDKVLERPHPDGHLVQVYQEDADAALIANVGRYLREGLRNGEALMVVANRRHREAFQKEIGSDAGRATFIDSGEMLARLMTRGQPDWARFEAEIGGAVQGIRQAVAGGGLRAYGDMVNLLWKSRQHASAIRLEQFWNKLLSRGYFSLYCAYSIDIFGTDFREAALDGILATHTHLIPAETNGHLEAALHRAMDEVLGGEADRIRRRIRAHQRACWAMMPAGERIALWLRTHLPEHAEEILRRARGHLRDAGAASGLKNR